MIPRRERPGPWAEAARPGRPGGRAGCATGVGDRAAGLRPQAGRRVPGRAGVGDDPAGGAAAVPHRLPRLRAPDGGRLRPPAVRRPAGAVGLTYAGRVPRGDGTRETSRRTAWGVVALLAAAWGVLGVLGTLWGAVAD